ncbi:MAG TPA: caspase family protein [Sphingomicrobium sp.]|nr:caspase family protein [Sphingomicrobium sp.]
MGRKACLAIGISDAPPLDYLPGAVNGAKAMDAWAKKAGYETKLLIDSKKPVGVEDVKKAMQKLLPQGTKTDRLILYFAGHGLARDAAEDLWLLSQWHEEQEAVAVGGLKRKLERFGIEQIAIISDACRSLPADADTADLTSDNVLGRGPYDPNLPLIDMLKASSKFRAAYMIPGATLDDDRCIFTGVIEEALWGHKPSAFSDHMVGNQRRITSGSLAKYLRSEVPVKAAFYKVELRPDIISGFLDPDDVYVTEPLAGAPAPKAWPAPAPPGAMGPDGGAPAGGKRGWSTVGQAAKAAPPDAAPATAPTPGAIILNDLGFAGSVSNWVPGVESSTRARPRMPASIAPRAPTPPPPESPPPETPEEERTRIEREASICDEKARGFLDSYRAENWPTHFETGSGFSLTGAKAVRGLIGQPEIVERDDDSPEWWRIRDPHKFELQRPLPMLVELDDGRWLGTTAIPKFIQTFTIDETGAVSVIYRPIGMAGAEAKAEEAVANLRAGMFRGGEAYDYALELRDGKHQDPMLGALAAYLYDSQGDVESIRQIAYFFANANQPIPFDVAMLARIKAERGNGVVVASIPAVAKRAPRTESEANSQWAYDATPAVEGVVAGTFPWLRQGWQLVDDGEPQLMPEGLATIRQHLTSAPFTTLTPEGGTLLGDLIFGDDR